MTTAELLTRRLYASLARKPENKPELDRLAEQMMDDARRARDELRRDTLRMLRGRGGE